MLQIRQESCRIIYQDDQPKFLLTQNGDVHWFSLEKTTMTDLEAAFDQKKV